jgi:hypothetical protein
MRNLAGCTFIFWQNWAFLCTGFDVLGVEENATDETDCLKADKEVMCLFVVNGISSSVACG